MALRRVRAGDPISEGVFNDVIDVANRSKLTVAQGSGLILESGPSGYVLSAAVPQTMYAKVTGAISGGSYPFLEQFADAAGAWSDGTVTGTAVEMNGNASVPAGKVVELEWTSAGVYVFEYGSC